MRRSWVISILIAGFMAWATVYLGPALWARHLPQEQAVGILMLFLVGGIALVSTVGGAIDHLRFVRRINLMAETGETADLTQGSGKWESLAQGINRLMEMLQDSADKSRRQAREMEIQFKVATAERQHARAILHSISDAVLVTNSFDEVVLANDAAAKILEFDLSTAQRRPLDQVLSDAKMIEMIRDVRKSGSANTRRVVEHTIGDEPSGRTFKLTLSGVADVADHPAGVVAVLHDMTREKEIAQMKTDFVSNVSHELRTPLASIKAYVEMLVDGEAGDEQTRGEFYDIIQNEANRLGRLIDNILNISRIESGLVKVNKQPLSPAVLVKEALEVIAPQAKSKNIRLEEKLTPVFYQTLADKDMLYQAVLNLLSNAVKYTPEGGVVTAEAFVDEAGKKVITRISDTGVGISPKDLPFVFDKFYRVAANNHMAKGTGLGLSLVRHIVESVHQGRMFVESNPGKGSTFGFELEMT
jgi:two-component system phosphate regulon sensor histidine kinase PhoR